MTYLTKIKDYITKLIKEGSNTIVKFAIVFLIILDLVSNNDYFKITVSLLLFYLFNNLIEIINKHLNISNLKKDQLIKLNHGINNIRKSIRNKSERLPNTNRDSFKNKDGYKPVYNR